MPVYFVKARARFEAAHHLRSYRGAPEPAHGHTWTVEAVLKTERLDGEGMAFDFVVLRRALEEIVRPFDHHDLNRIPPFDELSPTTEHVARYVHEALVAALPGAPLFEVTLWEGPDCAISYRGAGP